MSSLRDGDDTEIWDGVGEKGKCQGNNHVIKHPILGSKSRFYCMSVNYVHTNMCINLCALKDNRIS